MIKVLSKYFCPPLYYRELLAFTIILIRAVWTIPITVASLEIIDTGPVTGASVLGSFANATIGFVHAICAILDSITTVAHWLTGSVTTAEVANWSWGGCKGFQDRRVINDPLGQSHSPISSEETFFDPLGRLTRAVSDHHIHTCFPSVRLSVQAKQNRSSLPVVFGLPRGSLTPCLV